jgi:uncharacterized protein YlxP (DUF503 family)
MFVGVYRIELHIPASRSLKAKRSVLNGLKTRLGQLNLSVAEVEGQDTWQRATLLVSAVSAQPGYLDDLVNTIETVVLREARAVLLRIERDVRPALQ